MQHRYFKKYKRTSAKSDAGKLCCERWHQIDARLLLPFHPSMLQNHTARSYQEGSNSNLTQGMNLLKLEHKMTLKTKQDKCKGDSCGEQQLGLNNDLQSLKLDMNKLRLFYISK